MSYLSCLLLLSASPKSTPTKLFLAMRAASPKSISSSGLLPAFLLRLPNSSTEDSEDLDTDLDLDLDLLLDLEYDDLLLCRDGEGDLDTDREEDEMGLAPSLVLEYDLDLDLDLEFDLDRDSEYDLDPDLECLFRLFLWRDLDLEREAERDLESDRDLECELDLDLDLELIGEGDLDSISMISGGSSDTVCLTSLETMTSPEANVLLAESSALCSVGDEPLLLLLRAIFGRGLYKSEGLYRFVLGPLSSSTLKKLRKFVRSFKLQSI